MSVNSRLKTIQIIGQRKAFFRQRIPEFSCVRKETADIDILVTSRNGDRKIMQSTNYQSASSDEHLYRSSHQRCFIKKMFFKILRNSQENTGARVSLPATLLKKRLWHRCFPVNFGKFSRTPFLQKTSGWLLLPMEKA